MTERKIALSIEEMCIRDRLGRSCAGVGSAIITVITMLCVNALSGGEERVGFSRFTLIIAVLFVKMCRRDR